MEKKYTCQCCGYKTFDREDHLWEICEVCFWQSCPIQDVNPLYLGGPNHISLAESQQNFIDFGACERVSLSSVRKPRMDEPKDENWLIKRKSNMNYIQKFSNGMHYIMVDEKIVKSFIAQGSKRALCSIENTTFHCAFMPKKEGGHFINLGTTICTQLKLKEGDEITISFQKDDSEFQFEMPEEFSEVLYQDPDADAVFQGLTDGNKRGLIYVITLVKSSEKRIERALKIAEKLKIGIISPRLVLK